MGKDKPLSLEKLQELLEIKDQQKLISTLLVNYGFFHRLDARDDPSTEVMLISLLELLQRSLKPLKADIPNRDSADTANLKRKQRQLALTVASLSGFRKLVQDFIDSQPQNILNLPKKDIVALQGLNFYSKILAELSEMGLLDDATTRHLEETLRPKLDSIKKRIAQSIEEKNKKNGVNRTSPASTYNEGAQPPHGTKDRSPHDSSPSSSSDPTQNSLDPDARDFRSIPLLPSREELMRIEIPELPSLKIYPEDGAYRNIDHYLETQFTLLREDLVRPLNESLLKYLSDKGKIPIPLKLPSDHPDSKKELRKQQEISVSVYEKVEIRDTEVTQGGVVLTVSIDYESLQGINWKDTTKLVPGSLLLLSADDFETIYYATVAEREDEEVELRQQIKIKLEDFRSYSDVIRTKTFTAIESTTYFEAYRHTLKTLQNFNRLASSATNEVSWSFPLARYIVNLNLKLEYPPWIRPKTKTEPETTYDLSGLVEAIGGGVSDLAEGLVLGFRKRPLEEVPVLRYERYCSDLVQLDESQLQALYAALTKEFVIIQGPPGTGKTYVGKRIVQCLLANRHVWESWDTPECPNIQTKCNEQSPSRARGPCPILILGYKNHSLDHFLEGCLPIVKRLVRIGGRCQSEALKPCMMFNLRGKWYKNRQKNMPDWLGKRLGRVFKSMKECEKDIDILSSIITEIAAGVVDIVDHPDFLSEISSEHLEQLKNVEVDGGAYEADEIPISMRVAKWLGIESGGAEPEEEEGPNQKEKDVQEGKTTKKVPIVKNQRDLEANVRQRQSSQENGATTSEEGDKLETEDESCYRERPGLMMRHQREMDPDEFRPIGKEYLANDSTSKGYRENLPKIAKKLKCTINFDTKKEMMTVEEVEKIKDLHNLPSEQKMRLFAYWVDKYAKKIDSRFMSLNNSLQDYHEQLLDIKVQIDLLVIGDAEIVGMTTTGAAKYHRLVEALNPRIVIVEEAAEVLEPHLVASLTSRTRQLIMIGDHQQLRPITAVHELARDHLMEISLFERMAINEMPVYQLAIQHRMRPRISMLIRGTIYDRLDDHPSVKAYPKIEYMSGKNVFFFNSPHFKEDRRPFVRSSRSNRKEAEFIIEWMRYLIYRGISVDRITVLTTYNGQLALIKKLLGQDYDGDFRRGIRFAAGKGFNSSNMNPNGRNPPRPHQNIKLLPHIASVDSFQGEENDIILISFVRSNDRDDIGFLNIANRINVALSRAKHALYCVGNFESMAKLSSLWQDIWSKLEAKKCIANHITVDCECFKKSIDDPDEFRMLNKTLSLVCNCSGAPKGKAIAKSNPFAAIMG